MDDNDVIEVVWEFARKLPFKGYSASHLFSSDGWQYQSEDHRTNYTSLEKVPLPDPSEKGFWTWEGQWIPLAWEYAFNVASSSWGPSDGFTTNFRRRKWTRVRRFHRASSAKLGGGGTKPSSASPGRQLPSSASPANLKNYEHPVDLSEIRVVFKCRADRTPEQMATLVGIQGVQTHVLAYHPTHEFFGEWYRVMGIDPLGSILEKGALFSIVNMDDEDALAGLLHPILTESGEFRSESRIQDLSMRLKRFAIVLPGWQGVETFVVPSFTTQQSQRGYPPLVIRIHALESTGDFKWG